MGWYAPAPATPSPLPEKITERDLARYQREYDRAQAASLKAAERRRDLGPGSSRAAITSANAKWMTAAEYRDRLLDRLERAREVFERGAANG